VKQQIQHGSPANFSDLTIIAVLNSGLLLQAIGRGKLIIFSVLREIYDVFEGSETVKPRCW
jgi:hypothetical protein